MISRTRISFHVDLQLHIASGKAAVAQAVGKREHLREIRAVELEVRRLRIGRARVMIGAYTSLRDIETSAVILENFGPALREVLEHLIGVQLRNVITIGAHVASRFGFSDIIPTLLAMNASLRFYRGGVKSLWAYMNEDVPERDILLEIVLPKEGRRTKVQMMRLSYNDYSIFCLAASRVKENWIIAAGVFPGRAKLAEKTMSEMRDTPVTRGRAAELARRITAEYRFGTNYRGTAEYRRTLCEVFARRAIEELADEDSCKM